MKKLEIDYGKLWDIIKQNKLVVKDVSLKCGRSSGWLNTCKTTGAMMTEPMAEIVAERVGCNVVDFVVKHEIKPDPPKDMCTVLNDMTDEILSISEKVENLTNLVITQQADLLAILMGSDDVSSAVAILNALLCGNGKCKESVFRNACLRRKISTDAMKRALENTGAHYFMQGTGENGIRWITR